MKRTSQLLLGAIALSSVAWPASGQQRPALAPARVILIAGKSPSRGGRTEVIRQAQRTPQNIVIVDRNATADDLAGALGMLNALRAQYGDALKEDYRARPESVKHGPKWKDSEYRKWLHEQLVRLRKARERPVPGFGDVKAVAITLPARTGRVVSSSTGK